MLQWLRWLRAVHVFSCNLLEIKPNHTELIHHSVDVKDDVHLGKNSCPPVNFCLNSSKIYFLSSCNNAIERILQEETC